MEQNNSFLDSKTILAIIMVGVVWFGWQSYLQNRYPSMNQPQQSDQVADQAEKDDSSEIATSQDDTRQVLKELEDEADLLNTSRPERLFQFESGTLHFQITSKGMGIRQVVLPQYTDREGELVVLGRSPSLALFATKVTTSDNVLDFDIQQVSETEFEGIADYQGAQLKKRIKVNPQTYSFDIQTQVLATTSVPPLTTFLSDKIDEIEGGSSWFLPQFEHQEVLTIYDGGNEERINISELTEVTENSFERVTMASIGSQYFTSSVVDNSPIRPTLEMVVNPKENDVIAGLNYVPSSPMKKVELNTKAFVGPKSLPLLESVDPYFAETVNYGMFSVIARPLLRVLHTFYGLVGNWGVAIILLTLMVRLIVLPFNAMSFRSMKAMQKIQPHIQALREKYKNDPQTLNLEMMKLMRENKANPLGGCLPMLLQFPIFIALYQVLGQSIELYQAPFYGWIQDLSLKDPFYVLPILMGIAMFLQMRLTPSTMDPAQAKVMMFMPVLFTFLMVALPSGLTLYIFVSTLFGIVQQYYFLREKKPSIEAHEVKA